MTTEATDMKEKLGIAPGRKRWMRLVRWLVFLLLVGAGLGYWFNQQRAAAAHPAASYRTEPARVGDMTVTVTATGQLKPTRTVDVGSEVSGIIDQVLVNYNDTVEAGRSWRESTLRSWMHRWPRTKRNCRAPAPKWRKPG